MNRRILQLFRAWLPSWRFFETLSEQPVLFFRTGQEAEDVEAGEWRRALQRPPRTVFSVLLNGEGNLHLACYALLDQLEEDLSELDVSQIDGVPRLPSYQLVQNLVCFLLREKNELRDGGRYQFKVSRLLAQGADKFEDILVSPVHSA